MKQELIMWAVINNVTQKVYLAGVSQPALYNKRSDARYWMGHKKYYGFPEARVRKVKVTIEEAE
jgi:hypothetical protein